MTKEQRTISLHGTPLTYLLNNSARAKRVRISVSDAGVTLVLPVGLSIRDGEAFLLKNSDWVLQQLERRQKQQENLALPCQKTCSYYAASLYASNSWKNPADWHALAWKNDLITSMCTFPWVRKWSYRRYSIAGCVN
jgi:hypothetical protein